MKVLSFGSLNVDYVYRVHEFVRPGETVSCLGRSVICGGKGLNQSVALSRCGAKVSHAGNVGPGEDNEALLSALTQSGADVSLVRRLNAPGGHTVIQISDSGENSILLFGGTNLLVDKQQVDDTLAHFGKGDLLVMQNEINMLGYIMEQAKTRGMTIAFNPSPIPKDLDALPLQFADILFVNEIEAQALAMAREGEEPLTALCKKYPKAMVVMTLGGKGAVTAFGGQQYFQKTFPVSVVDTTVAGDTFMGYFLGAWLEGKDIPSCMNLAARAAAICVSRLGASVAIPNRDEVETFCP